MFTDMAHTLALCVWQVFQLTYHSIIGDFALSELVLNIFMRLAEKSSERQAGKISQLVQNQLSGH